MSDETFRLLTSSEAVTGYLVGIVALLAVAFWWVFARRPIPAAGIAIALGSAAAIDRVYDAPVELLAGLGLLVLAGLIPVESDIAVMALTIPGAALIGYTYVDAGQPELIVLVTAGTVLFGALVARYDSPATGDATTLLVIAYLGVLIIVPDTDIAIVIAAVALPMAAAGFPARIAHVGRSGALAATGLLMWTIASGAAARTAALIVGVAALGILIADPLVRIVRGKIQPAVPAKPLAFVVQGAVSVGLALLVGFVGDQPLLAAPVAAAALLVAGLWSAV